MQDQVDEVLSLTFVDQNGQEQEVEVTAEHPFSIGERRWQQARDLKLGARVYDISGNEIELLHTEVRQGIFFVYNLEFEGQDFDNNNYFVSHLGLLVHNCQILGASSVGLRVAMIGASYIGVGGIVLTAVPTALIGGGFIFIKIAHSQDFASAVDDAIIEAALIVTGNAMLSRAEKGFLLVKRGKEGLGEVRRASEKIIEAAEKWKINSDGLKGIKDIPAAKQSEVLKKFRQGTDAVIDYIGPDARFIRNKAGDVVVLSKDGTRRVRFNLNNPYPHSNPHTHVEEFMNGQWKKSGLIYPINVRTN